MATILKYKAANGYRWRVRWWDENEKQVSKSFDRQALAKDFMVKLENDMREGYYTAPTNMKVGEFLSQWIDGYASTVSPSTARSYRVNINHINKYIGSKQLQRLMPMDIENAYKELSQALNGTSILYIHRTISRAFKQAEKQKLITRNVFTLVETPKKSKEKQVFLHSPG